MILVICTVLLSFSHKLVLCGEGLQVLDEAVLRRQTVQRLVRLTLHNTNTHTNVT